MFVKEFSSAKEPMVSPATAMKNSAGIMGADEEQNMLEKVVNSSK